jgi:glycosyltransferase involved in cell wall biosynthesis
MVSVIIATRNRQQLLAQTLRALVGQRWPADRFEILVADNGSSDQTRAIVEAEAARAAPSIRYLHVPVPGKSHAVNDALSQARGELLALTDDDVQPDDTWLERLSAAIDETGADFVAGRIFPIWECPPPRWLSPQLYGVLAIPDNGDQRMAISSASDSPVIPIGANMAVRASVIAHIGGLRTDLGKLAGTLRTGEDHEFFLRMLAAGYRGVYEPTAVVRHWVPRERLERGYCRRWLYQNGRDVARLDATHAVSARRLLGVPRYMWRRGAGQVWDAARATFAPNAAARFAATVGVLWLGGYVREAWFGRHLSRRLYP